MRVFRRLLSFALLVGLPACVLAASPSPEETARATLAARQMLPTFVETQGLAREVAPRLRLGVPLPMVSLTIEDIREAADATEEKRNEILERWSGELLFPVRLDGKLVGYLKVRETAQKTMEVSEMGGESSPQLEFFRARERQSRQLPQ